MYACLLFILIFYGICIFGLCCSSRQNSFLKTIQNGYAYIAEHASVLHVVLVILIPIAVLSFVAYEVCQNNLVYFWDYGGYWQMSIERANGLNNLSSLDILKSTLSSINTEDYNILIPTILALPMRFFGLTFTRYVFICAAMFLLPIIFITGLIALKVCKNTTFNKCTVFLIGCFIAVVFPSHYYALFFGYCDIAFLVPALIAVYIFLDYDFKRINISKNIAIALLLLLAWFCRRYVIYFLIGFVVAMAFKAVVVCVQTKSAKCVKTTLLNAAIITLLALGILCIFFNEFFFKALFTNYSYIYAAYNATLDVKVQCLINTFGVLSAITVICIGGMCLYRRNKQTINYFALLLMGGSAVILFWQTQNMGSHHRTLLNPTLLTIFAMGIQFLPLSKKSFNQTSQKVTCIIASFCLIMMPINFCKAFVPALSENLTSSLFSFRYTPTVRNDMQALRNLVDKLNTLTAGTNDTVYVTAAGSILNADTLRKLDMPYSTNAVHNLQSSSDVDLRDGFPVGFLHSKYIVSTTPIETTDDADEKVVTYLAAIVNDSSSYIGRHFDKVYETTLDNNVQAAIYEKNSEFTSDDINELRNYFTNLYPNEPDKFYNRIQ